METCEDAIPVQLGKTKRKTREPFRVRSTERGFGPLSPHCLSRTHCQQGGRGSEEIGKKAIEPEKRGNAIEAVGETDARGRDWKGKQLDHHKAAINPFCNPSYWLRKPEERSINQFRKKEAAFRR
jgi:hypothetical protein